MKGGEDMFKTMAVIYATTILNTKGTNDEYTFAMVPIYMRPYVKKQLEVMEVPELAVL